MSFRKYYYYLVSIFKMLFGLREWPMVIKIFLHLPIPQKKIIHLRKTDLRFQVRGPMDVWSIKETFLDRFYERFGTPLQNGWAVVDIGAGIGEYALFAAAGHKGNRVHAYEPFPESFSLLEENCSLNPMDGVEIFMEAVGGQAGTAILDLGSGEPLQFSTESPAQSSNALQVPAISLAEVISRIGGRCNLLKLDCEGAEYAILFSAPDASLQAIDHIVMEYHDGVTAYSHLDLVEFLKHRGFSAKTTQNYVHSQLGYLHAFRPSAG
jgi:FkbM family methyltransferase